jgi:Calcineurin-like phosphoesterase
LKKVFVFEIFKNALIFWREAKIASDTRSKKRDNRQNKVRSIHNEKRRKGVILFRDETRNKPFIIIIFITMPTEEEVIDDTTNNNAITSNAYSNAHNNIEYTKGQDKLEPPDANTMRIMLSTDNHLGYEENDAVRGMDSFAAFEEVLYLAKRFHCDMVLIAGDIFHENRPSRQTLFKTMEIIRR